MVRIKGRQKPLKIYGLFSGEFLDEPRRHINEYHKALKLYRQRKFEDAHFIFAKFRTKGLIGRSTKFIRNGVPIL